MQNNKLPSLDVDGQNKPAGGKVFREGRQGIEEFLQLLSLDEVVPDCGGCVYPTTIWPMINSVDDQNKSAGWKVFREARGRTE
ncbi:hypothetical protein CEXT_712161 [Caerostris extrusa]|uniref:Uncharacterized protein n=1 Tax=Caerostris extrusa TaxID=172846 RepID=A0AAV4WSH0_CAEEX|nr:hypothetical protein CEXT_712161 [Caerostris extrusa]